MTEEELYKLRFPVGDYVRPDSFTSSDIENWTEDIREFPDQLRKLTEALGSDELNWKYRPDGWNIKQVVHHCADSHMNAWSRFKLAMTEENPAIRPYHEDRWAKLPESNLDDLTDSLLLLESLHRKWVRMLEFMSSSDFERTFFHPEYGISYNLAQTLASYAWHCRHHLSHVKQALESKGGYNG